MKTKIFLLMFLHYINKMFLKTKNSIFKPIKYNNNYDDINKKKNNKSNLEDIDILLLSIGN